MAESGRDRQCPSCGAVRPRGDFLPVRLGSHWADAGNDWRRCPSCGHKAPGWSFRGVEENPNDTMEAAGPGRGGEPDSREGPKGQRRGGQAAPLEPSGNGRHLKGRGADPEDIYGPAAWRSALSRVLPVYAALVVLFGLVGFVSARVLPLSYGSPPDEGLELLAAVLGVPLFMAAVFAPALAQSHSAVRLLALVPLAWWTLTFLFIEVTPPHPLLEVVLKPAPAMPIMTALTVAVVLLGFGLLNSEADR